MVCKDTWGLYRDYKRVTQSYVGFEDITRIHGADMVMIKGLCRVIWGYMGFGGVAGKFGGPNGNAKD